MKKTLTALLLCICATLFAQTEDDFAAFFGSRTQYLTPILPGFHSDPSVCRVGEDYYLVNSTFEFFPGVPVFHSKDLVHWEQIGNCLTRKSQLDLTDCPPSGGVFAPTIRYDNGRFYMITTVIVYGSNFARMANFIVHTTNPAGEWSEPIIVNQGGIDPSLYFEDGKCYLVSNPNNTIMLSQIDPLTGEFIMEPKAIWTGTGGTYPEGPHIYKKDDWYYLLIAEGGTQYGHKVTIARSKTIDGIYESNPANPLITHAKKDAQTSQIQGVGHADLVDAIDGSWWMVCHGFRTMDGDHHLLGRESFVVPVRWDTNAWPVVNFDGTLAVHEGAHALPSSPVKEVSGEVSFNEDKLGFEWNYLRNPDESKYSLTSKKGYLRMFPTTVTLDDTKSPTFIGRRQEHIDFTCATSVSLNADGGKGTNEAGLTVFMNNNFHYDLFLQKEENGGQSLVLRYRIGNITHIEKKISVDSPTVYLQVKGDTMNYSFAYSTDNKTFQSLGAANTRLLSTETAGGFTGIYLGLYATTTSDASKAYADFDWFEYK